MKKNIIIAALTLTMSLALLAGCGANNTNGNTSEKDIGKDSAKEIALSDANLKESETSNLRVTEDYENSKKVYDVEFDGPEKEYNYEISASDGTILSHDTETHDNIAKDTTKTNTQDAAASNTTSSETTQDETPTISEEDAKKAVLDRVPGATEANLKIEYEFDDGRYTYEGEINYEQKEYEFEIDATTGNFLKWSEEKY